MIGNHNDYFRGYRDGSHQRRKHNRNWLNPDDINPDYYRYGPGRGPTPTNLKYPPYLEDRRDVRNLLIKD